MTMDMSGLAPVAGGAKFEIRMVDGVMYMSIGSLLGNLRPASLAGKEWVEVDTGQLGMTQDQLTNQNPADMLESLRGAGNVTEVGTQDIDGVETRQFRADIDPSKAIDRLPAGQRTQAADVPPADGLDVPHGRLDRR